MNHNPITTRILLVMCVLLLAISFIQSKRLDRLTRDLTTTMERVVALQEMQLRLAKLMEETKP